MNTSLRGSRRGGDEGPFVMNLERVCDLISRGATFTVEFHP